MANTYSVNASTWQSTRFSRCSNGTTDTYMPTGVSAFDTDWYRSNNKGSSSSTATATITLNIETACLVFIDVLDYQNESTYDYGTLTYLDSPAYVYSGSGNHDWGGKTVSYGVVSPGTHHIYASYIKDSSVDNPNDRLYFRVRIIDLVKPVFIGEDAIEEIYVGSSKIAHVFVGTDKIY